MVLPPLEQLPVGMLASLTRAFQTAEQRRDYQTYLLVAHAALKAALAAPPPEDPGPGGGGGPGGGAEYRGLGEPNPERGYYLYVLMPAYNARRDRLLANLKRVEQELPEGYQQMTLSEDYQRMLQDLLE